MADQITISKTLSIRDCGYDENWLQEQIAAKPNIIGLGDLVLVEREKRQLSGGKLDILLKNREGDTLFEVEVMLGETDGDHISRTIEYWDLEQRQDLKRKHFPVLIAEGVTRRFFNLIYRLSLSIPIVAIKANIVEVEGKNALHFTTILNAFQDSEADGRRQIETASNGGRSVEDYWQKKSPATLVAVQNLRKAIPTDCPRITIYYQKRSVSIMYKGYYVFRIKPEGKHFLVEFWLNKRAKTGAKLIESKGLSFDRAREKDEVRFGLKADDTFIGKNSEMFAQIAKLVVEDIDL